MNPYRIILGMPGPRLLWCAASGLMRATAGHEVVVKNSGNGWDDMNVLWVDALNSARRGECTHFAMLHSDISPCDAWLDVLVSELDRLGGDMISTVIALKDERGLTSSGIGDAQDRWSPYRRFTVRELVDMPETFSIEDTEYPDRYLLHNTGCWLADLRNPDWYTTDSNNTLQATLRFDIAASVSPQTGKVSHLRESEDWHFSRMVAHLGLRTFCTRKIAAKHFGEFGFPNDKPWGQYTEGDEATSHKWRAELCPT